MHPNHGPPDATPVIIFSKERSCDPDQFRIEWHYDMRIAVFGLGIHGKRVHSSSSWRHRDLTNRILQVHHMAGLVQIMQDGHPHWRHRIPYLPPNPPPLLWFVLEKPSPFTLTRMSSTFSKLVPYVEIEISPFMYLFFNVSFSRCII